MLKTLGEKNYQSSRRDLWQGRQNGSTPERFHEVIQLIDLKNGIPFAETPLAWGILGFACDEGIKRNSGRCGAAKGPEAIRKALGNFPIKRATHQTFYDLGDVHCHQGNLEEAQAILADIVTHLLKNNIRPLVIGGGHEVAWGNYRGLIAAHPEKDCMIINFDSHFDLRPLIDQQKGSSGTSFQQIANLRHEQELGFNCCYLGIQPLGNVQTFFDKAEELNAKVILADEFHEGGTEASVEIVQEIVNQSDMIYTSICLDVFATPFAPGVSAPQPLGIFPWHAIPALKHLAASGKVVSLDIAEMCPAYDIDNTTAKLAASLISIFIQHSFQEE